MRQIGGARLEGGEEGDDELLGARRSDRDPVLRSDALRDQTAASRFDSASMWA
ncbi:MULTISPECIES: hypothetical protein [unclassified Streptomyces]|uniref:hypothetical protein n=1 Tax=unclassified Streptomyces TaxID=2593676 RepID=UPI00339207A8